MKITERRAMEERQTIRYFKNTCRDYPQILNRYERMPEGLYLLGAFPDPERPSVAIVGARSCSEYGRSEAVRFSKVLAAAGVQIISGMALGIDCAAHEGALEAGGRTFAVLGCGADICYPASKRNLYRRIPQNGGILSEYESGTPAMAHHFPVRNRIISGLADAVLVIEARRKSGSLITAFHAIEQNKTLYALPGRIRESLSEGTNDLICQGAVPLISPEQVLRDLGVPVPEEQEPEKGVPAGLSAEERKLYRCVSADPKTLDCLHEESGLTLRQTAVLLTELCLRGYVREAFAGRFVTV